MSHDVIVIGGSYAGLSAAMQLARARRRVVVIDAGLPRNRFAAGAHGFLGQDGRPPADILREHGAVSRETAEAMARGALGKAKADLVVAITGIAGPGGGSPGKSVGLVHFAAGTRAGALTHHEARYGDIGRSLVREKSVLQALAMLREMAEKEPPKPPAVQS